MTAEQRTAAYQRQARERYRLTTPQQRRAMCAGLLRACHESIRKRWAATPPERRREMLAYVRSFRRADRRKAERETED